MNLNDLETFVIVAEEGTFSAAEGVVVGFAKSAPWNSRGAYARTVEVSVYVHPDAHRQGIGRALYARLFPLLRAQDHRAVLAGITLPNPGSVGLHEAFGMRQVAHLEAVGFKFGVWHDVGYWQVRWPPMSRGVSRLKVCNG